MLWFLLLFMSNRTMKPKNDTDPKRKKWETKEERGRERERKEGNRENKTEGPQEDTVKTKVCLSCPPCPLPAPCCSAPDLKALGWVCKLFLSDLNIWPPCPLPAIKHRQGHYKRKPATSAKTNKQASQCSLQLRETLPTTQEHVITLFVCLPLFVLPHFYVVFMLRGHLCVGPNMVCVCRRTWGSSRSIYQPHFYLGTYVGVHMTRSIFFCLALSHHVLFLHGMLGFVVVFGL